MATTLDTAAVPPDTGRDSADLAAFDGAVVKALREEAGIQKKTAARLKEIG